MNTLTATPPVTRFLPEIFIDGYFLHDGYGFASQRCKIGSFFESDTHGCEDQDENIFHYFDDLDDLYRAVNSGTTEFKVITYRINTTQDANAVLSLLDHFPSDGKVTNYYDDHPILGQIFDMFIPSFEYPNVSYKTIGQMKQHISRLTT